MASKKVKRKRIGKLLKKYVARGRKERQREQIKRPDASLLSSKTHKQNVREKRGGFVTAAYAWTHIYLPAQTEHIWRRITVTNPGFDHDEIDLIR
jgi:hypothetical protein